MSRELPRAGQWWQQLNNCMVYFVHGVTQLGNVIAEDKDGNLSIHDAKMWSLEGDLERKLLLGDRNSHCWYGIPGSVTIANRKKADANAGTDTSTESNCIAPRQVPLHAQSVGPVQYWRHKEWGFLVQEIKQVPAFVVRRCPITNGISHTCVVQYVVWLPDGKEKTVDFEFFADFDQVPPSDLTTTYTPVNEPRPTPHSQRAW